MVSGELLKQLGAFRASCRNPKTGLPHAPTRRFGAVLSEKRKRVAIPFLAVWNLATCSKHEALYIAQVSWFCLSSKLSTQLFSMWMFVSSFLPLWFHGFWRTFEAAGCVPSVMSQPQKQDCHTLQRVDLARSKAKSGSAWQSHFWQCGTLRPARNTKLFTLRK